MFTIEKANKLLEICYNEYSSLKDQNIFIVNEEKDFFVQHGFIGDTLESCSIINITEELKRDSHFKSWSSKYIKEKFNIDDNIYMFYNFEEVFAFLHEVGHVYYKDMQDDSKSYYQLYKEKEYKSYNEMFLAYRTIPAENLADTFASIVMKNQLISIWSLMNDITEEKATEEYNFWNN